MTTNRPPAPQSEEDASLDEIFGALSDASRRKILQLLRQAGQLRVTDVAAVFDMSLNGVSKHLKVLEKAGLVRREVRGREHWLRSAPERLSPALRFLHTFRQSSEKGRDGRSLLHSSSR